MDIIMGSAKKKIKKAIGGSKPKAPKAPEAPKAKAPEVAPAVAPTTVTSGGDQSQVNTGRRAQSILDPMQAKEDENKDILG